MSTSWIVTIIVIAFLIFFAIMGFRKGFLRIILTTLALVVTMVAAGVLVPWFSGVVGNSFIGKNIDERIGSYLSQTVNNPIVNTMEEAQEAVIDKLPLPSFVRNDISENNNASEYLTLKVTSFTEYLKTRLVSIANNTIAYIILLVFIYIIIRILLAFSRAISRIPIIGGINRFFGFIVGLLEGLLVLWCICLLIMLISGSPFGMKVVEVINGNAFLKFIYENNGIVIGVNALFHALI